VLGAASRMLTRTCSNIPMKLLATTAVALVLTSSAAFAWTDRAGHWHEGPQLYGPINRGALVAPYGPPPAYFYGPPPPVAYGPPPMAYGYPPVYGPPAYYPPSDAQVIAGTIMGIAGMVINGGRRW